MVHEYASNGVPIGSSVFVGLTHLLVGPTFYPSLLTVRLFLQVLYEQDKV